MASQSPSSSALDKSKPDAYRQLVENNMKAFKSLSEELSSGQPDLYINAASKLSRWLASPKAYYLEGREYIVTMLEAACLPLVRQLALNSSQDFHISMSTLSMQKQAVAYATLVRAVKPHLHRFPEEDLKSRLVNVFSTVHVSLPAQQALVSSSPHSTADQNVQLESPNAISTSFNVTTPELLSKSTTPGSPNPGGSKHSVDIPSRSVLHSPGEQSNQNSTFMTPNTMSMPPEKLNAAGELRQPPTSVSSSKVINIAKYPDAAPRNSQPYFPSQSPASAYRNPADIVPAQPLQRGSHPETLATSPSKRSSLPTAADKRPSLPPKFKQFVALDLDSYKRSQTQSKGRQPSGVSLQQRTPVVASISPDLPSKEDTIRRDGQDQLEAAPEREPEQTSETAVIPSDPSQEGLEKRDMYNVLPRVEDALTPRGDPRSSASLPSVRSPAVNLEQSVTAGPPHPAASLGQPTALDLSGQPVETTVFSGGELVVHNKGSLVSAVTPSQTMLPSREANEHVEHTNEISWSFADLPEHAPVQQTPKSADVSAIGTSQDVMSLSDREPVMEGPAGVAPVPGSPKASNSGDLEHPVLQPLSPSHGTPQEQAQPAIEVQIDQAVCPHGNESDADSFDDNMEVSAIALSSPHATPEHSASSQGEPASAPTDAPLGNEPPGTSRLSQGPALTRKIPPENTSETVLERDNAPTDATGVLSSSDIPKMISGSVIPSGNVPIASQTTLLLDGGIPNVSSHSPEAQSSSYKEGSTEAAKEDIVQQADAPSDDNERTGKLTVLAQHFLQTRSPENMRHAVPQLARNIEKLITSLPSETIEEITQVAKKSRAVSSPKHGCQVESGGSPTQVAGSANSGAKQAIFTASANHDPTSTMSPNNAKKRRRSQSLDDPDIPPSHRRTNDIVPAVVGAPGEDTSADMRVSARQSPPTAPQRSENMTLADASNLARKAESITAPIVAYEDGTAEKENTPQEADVAKHRQQRPSSSIAPLRHEEEAAAVSDLSQHVRDGRRVLESLSYHPKLPFEIVAIIEGSRSPHVHEVNLELDERQAAMVSRWNNRHHNYDQTAPCISITLMCARLAEIETWTERHPGATIEEATRNMQIQWPTDGGAWITVEQDSSTSLSLTLSPPGNIKSHEPLDLSPIIGPRITKIRLTQISNISDFVFAIRAHRPTEAQLHALHETNLEKLAWHDTLSRLSAPFERISCTDVLSTLSLAV